MDYKIMFNGKIRNITSLDDKEIQDYVISQFSKFEDEQRDYYIDSLEILGRKIVPLPICHIDLQDTVEKWLVANLNSLRMAISASFLIGYWSSCKFVSESLVDILVSYLTSDVYKNPRGDIDTLLSALSKIPYNDISTGIKKKACNTLKLSLEELINKQGLDVKSGFGYFIQNAAKLCIDEGYI